MYNAARRGPASVARFFNSFSPATRSNPSLFSHLHFSAGGYGRPCSAIRTLSCTSILRQQASAPAIEAEIEQEVNAQRPPSDSQIKEAIQHGPITKFKGLSERRMVCDTLIRTITEDMRLETMTQVQSMTINETLKGIDV